MTANTRGPIELLDQIYTMAFWMTGSLTKTHDLVYRTYQHVDSDTSEVELFRTFRNLCNNRLDLENGLSKQGTSSGNKQNDALVSALRQQEMDSIFTALLSDLCGLKHSSIAIILGKPLGTIRLWLSSGRRAIANGLLAILALACGEPAFVC
ncbi:MAG: RNA polymerase subunit sigma-24 [Chlorobi bacterium]|nr:RNA polymerase subunit sigma-24 [Chlorobiota bacterium]